MILDVWNDVANIGTIRPDHLALYPLGNILRMQPSHIFSKPACQYRVNPFLHIWPERVIDCILEIHLAMRTGCLDPQGTEQLHLALSNGMEDTSDICFRVLVPFKFLLPGLLRCHLLIEVLSAPVLLVEL